MRFLLFGLMGAAVVGAAAWWVGTIVRRGLEDRLHEAGSELRRLSEASVWRERGDDAVRREVLEFRGALEELRARDQERRAREEEGWAVLQRVAAVLAGGRRAGQAGENVLREAFVHLPPSMVETDFRVNGKVVEFALVMPDGRRLPVDSKWPADRELRELAEATEPAERDRLERLVERAVVERAREVAAYRDPESTSPVGVAAVPDAAYGVLRRAHADAYRQGVIVIPYSMALPVVLFLHSIVGRFGAQGDVEGCLSDLGGLLDALEGVLENKVARAATMLSNGTEELRGFMGKARATVSRARSIGEAPVGPGEIADRPRLVEMIPGSR